MNIAEMLGTPVNDPADIVPTPAAPCVPAPPPQPANPGHPRRGRLVWAALIATALVVGVGAGWYLASTGSPPPVPLTAAHSQVDQVGEYAEMYAALYLSGRTPPGAHDGMSTGNASTATGTWVNHSAPLAVESLGHGFWNVTVVVDALELAGDVYESAGLQYFAVTVDSRSTHPVAVAPPARIPQPPAIAPTDLPQFTTEVPPDQAGVVTKFLDGYLTGQADVARYITPTAPIQLFASSPYESVSIDSMHSDSLGRVAASVSATTATGAAHNLQYTVEMSFASGFWEVAGLTAPVITE
ncbi:MAG: conjugal transfer protein [bacterium]|nr:conjugal transfer protein [bacterium]